MRFRVVLEPKAHQQFKETVRWLSGRSPAGAERWLNAFDDAVEQLEQNADGCSLAPENSLVKREIRQTLFKTPRGRMYRMVFMIVGADVRVLAIRGSGQAPLKRRDLK
jgi:plasmid stabilization system protein ParE